MRTCEVAVVGLGLMGAAALHALRRRKVDALGFDPLPIGSAKGSSHGSCRIFRRFNFENSAYTGLSDQANAGWRSLESLTGKILLKPSLVLEAGPPGSNIVQASRAAAASHGLLIGPTTGAEANAAFPAFQLPEDWDVVVQDSGGILMVEEALKAFRQGACEKIVPEAVRVVQQRDGIHLYGGSQKIIANQVVVAAGPWLASVVPDIKPLLTITRQTVGWFAPAKPRLATTDCFPIFLLDGPLGIVYGFPDFEGRGVKAGRHDRGPEVGPDEWDPPPSEQELEPVKDTLNRFIPGAAGRVTDRDVCLYTNSRPADVRIDLGDEFIIDRLPSDPRVIVASVCSGHGAKFAVAIGELLANLAIDPAVEADPAFKLDRFSQFVQ